MVDISAEPSMEDILASIKRIIAEEGDDAVSSRVRRPAPFPTLRSEFGSFGRDEILELSDPLAPSGDETDATGSADAGPEAPAARRDPILSPRAAEASRDSLDTLSRMVVRPEHAGSDTLEGLVRELLRPMLSEWLDANLPAMVEGMVAREITRITGAR